MSVMGRPTKYTDELVKKAKAYITDYAIYGDVIPSIAGLSSYLKVNRSSLYEWESLYKDFSDILRAIKAEQEKVLINKGLIGDFNSAITKLVLGKHGYHDRQDLDITGDMSINIGKEFEGI